MLEKAYMYKEGKVWWVVYGGNDFFGPNEQCFNTKAEAKKFMDEQNKTV